MQPTAHAVEISPPYNRPANHFRNLASFAKVGYTAIEQIGDFSDVDVDEVVSKVAELWVQSQVRK